MLGRHALSCKHSERRHSRHAALNEILKGVLTSAHIPSRLEPTGLSKTDGKHPDGATTAPWKSGCLLVWGATCLDTFATSYRAHTTLQAGRVAEDRKGEKYRDLPASHIFIPVAIETMGAFGLRSLSFVQDLGNRVAWECGEPKSTEYLLQRLSVAVQQGSSMMVLGGMIIVNC